MADIIRMVMALRPNLRRELFAAHMTISPTEYVRKAATSSFGYGIMLGVCAFLFLIQMKFDAVLSLVAGIVLAIGVFFGMVQLQLRIPEVKILKRAQEIDNEVLFAGRFLLVKLGAGKPLFNALIATSQSYGVASKYFKEIVDDINFGTPIEIALNNAMEASPSRYFKKILFQINNALRVGVDVTTNLEIVLKEIEEEQALEIEKYGKKMSSVALFYMLLAIVLPSLGMTLFVVVASMLALELNWLIYGAIIAGIILIQFFFMTLFRQIRPTVNV